MTDYNSEEFWKGAPERATHLIPEGIDLMVSRPTTQWSGDGLPPVGTVCELSSQGADWGIGTIQYTADNVIVWRWENQAVGQACACYKHEIEIRPIRTPEQIAAEEREKAIIDIARTIMPGTVCAGLEDMKRAEKLYEAGYRKQGDQP